MMSNKKSVAECFSHERYEWLDQARGIIVLFLVVAAIAWPLADGEKRLEPALSPTFLNHGFIVADSDPPVVTMVDNGAQMFMFVLGFLAYSAFTRRMQRRGPVGAWFYVSRRVALLYLVGFSEHGLLPLLEGHSMRMGNILFQGVFARLAIASFAGYLAIQVLPKPKYRVLLSAVMMAAHFLLYHYHVFDQAGVDDGHLGLMSFGWGAWNMAAIAILATAFGQWVFAHPRGIAEGMRTRMFPATVWVSIAYYVVSWLQPEMHFDLTTPHALLGVCFGAYLILICYGFHKVGMRLPAASALGRNVLVLFIVVGLSAEFYTELFTELFDREFYGDYRVITLIIFGIIPYLVTISLGLLLDRKRIYIRP
jgi:hypothetical protein